MARIPEHEIEQLRQQVSLVRLIEADGIALTKQGKDYACRCPFHDDATPSLIVTPTKNLYHCFGCNAAGGPIDWVMNRRGVSFRHAVETLRTELGLIDAPVVTTARTDRPELTGPDVKLVYAARSSFAGVILGRVASGAGGR